jgi:hypothetical protein
MPLHRYILPICSYHNAQGTGTYFTLERDIEAVKISKLSSSVSETGQETHIPVPAGTEHDPTYQTIHVGTDANGQPLYSTAYMGSLEHQASKVVPAGPDLEHVKGGDDPQEPQEPQRPQEQHH